MPGESRSIVVNARLERRVVARALLALRKNGLQISGVREKVGVSFEICPRKGESLSHYEAIEKFNRRDDSILCFRRPFFARFFLPAQF
jgi:hypothetical protein